ncbi:MAG: SCO family protein [Rubrivivax sp.]
MGLADAAWTRALLPAAAAAVAAAGPAPDYRLARQDVARLPDIALVTMHKRATTLARELDTDQPLWLNFVFTTCSTTCSMQTAVLAALQARLQREQRAAKFLSLTIDPEGDTPEAARRVRRPLRRAASWRFCTGRFEDLLLPQRAFDVYRGSKAAHPPVVLLRAARGAPWWRVTGFPTPEDLHGVLLDKLRRA